MSCVGLSEEDAKRRAVAPFVVGRAFYRDNARGKIIGDKDGVIKLVFERERRGSSSAATASAIARASSCTSGRRMITLGGTVDTLIEMVFNYPTLSEMFKYAAYDALGAIGRTEQHSSVG